MMISGLLVWIPYHLQMKTSIVNISSHSKDITSMYDNNLPHTPASNQVTYVLLACFPMSYSSIRAIPTCTLTKDHL